MTSTRRLIISGEFRFLNLFLYPPYFLKKIFWTNPCCQRPWLLILGKFLIFWNCNTKLWEQITVLEGGGGCLFYFHGFTSPICLSQGNHDILQYSIYVMIKKSGTRVKLINAQWFTLVVILWVHSTRLWLNFRLPFQFYNFIHVLVNHNVYVVYDGHRYLLNCWLTWKWYSCCKGTCLCQDQECIRCGKFLNSHYFGHHAWKQCKRRSSKKTVQRNKNTERPKGV